MSRPTREESIYQVSIHRNGGYMYASTHPYTTDEKTGKRKYVNLHWGTVEDGNRFIPGKRYIFASPEERARLVFPKDWDLSEANKLSGAKSAGRPAYTDTDRNRFYGDIWLLEQVAAKTGLRDDLNKVFEGNAEYVDSVLTLAYFSVLTGYSYNRVARWQRIEKTPYGKELSPAAITYLTQNITESERMKLFCLRAARLSDNAVCAVDSTTRSAYGDALADIKWGKNKEGVRLPQTSEVVVYSLDDHMPVYYRTFPGNIPDSRSVETLLTDLKHAGFPDVALLTDRGYESVQNLERYILASQKMVMCVKVNQEFVLKRIMEYGDFAGAPEQMSIDIDTQVFYRQYDIDYDVRGNGNTVHKADRYKLNIYFDPIKRGSDISAQMTEIEMQKAALQDMLDNRLPLDDDNTVKRLYRWFNIEYDNNTRIISSFSLNEKKVAMARRTSGFYAIATLGMDLTAMQAWDLYGLRDEQEKYFQQMKSQLGFNRQRNWSEEGKTGRLFVLFVGLVLSSYVRHIWKTTNLHKQFSSTLEVLDEMRSIRCIEHTNRAKFITPFVGGQLDICEAFGFKIPEGCTPKYTSRKKSAPRRGRPSKPRTTTLES